jgi:hypothetical protein
MNTIDDGNHPDNSLVYSIEDKPFGLTWADWTCRWWQWLLSIPKEKNPVLGNIQDNFYLNQRREVIFLVGTLGGAAERRYIIPSDKPALFPIINFITSFVEEPDLKTDFDLILRAKKDIDDIVKKQAVIDGVNLQDIEKYRIRSSVFELRYAENNVFELPSVSTRAISDGYWVFLKPLRPGLHHIYAAGSCSSGKTKVDITWHLDVRD